MHNIILIFTTLSQPVICNMSCIHNYIYQYYTVMYTIVHFHKLYASTCAFTFDNLHPVEQLLPRDATDAYLVHYGNNNIYHRRYAIYSMQVATAESEKRRDSYMYIWVAKITMDIVFIQIRKQ